MDPRVYQQDGTTVTREEIIENCEAYPHYNWAEAKKANAAAFLAEFI